MLGGAPPATPDRRSTSPVPRTSGAQADADQPQPPLGGQEAVVCPSSADPPAEGRRRMSKDKHHEPLHEMEMEVLPVNPGDPKWQEWFLDLDIGIKDMVAVLRDLLRKKRKRNLGHREAKRLYREARDKLLNLLAAAGGGGDDGDGGDKGRPEPATPADAAG